MPLVLSPDLALPDQAVTDTLAVLGRRGSGKTYAAKKLAEEMLEAGQQIVAIDPTGSWWGLRSSATGKSAGYPVIVLGGNHGDAPLEATGGELVADLIVETGRSVVLDLSLMKKGERARFLADFGERLYYRKATARSPLHLFVDEAHAFVPQRPQDGQQRMLGAGEDLVQMGRSRGLGVTLISQRPAVINKNVLSQVAGLICLQLTGSHDRKAVSDWIDEVGNVDLRAQALGTLSGLERGHALVWVPHLRIFEQVAIGRARTYDSSATPELGEQLALPAKRADVDLAALADAMAETIERAKANDPKALRARVAELDRELASARAAEPAEVAVPVEVVPAVVTERVEQLRSDLARVEAVAQDLSALIGALDADAAATVKVLAAYEASTTARDVPRALQAANAALLGSAPALPRGTPRGVGVASATLAKAERAVLTVLAQHPEGRTKQQVALTAGYSAKGGGFGNAVSKCRTSGYLIDLPDGRLQITVEGVEAVGEVEPLPTGQDLVDHWKRQLGKAERLALQALVDATPRWALTKEELAAACGRVADADAQTYEPSGGGFGNALSRLRTLGLLEGPSTAMTAAEVLL